MELFLISAAICLLLVICALCIALFIKTGRQNSREDLDRMSRNISASINDNMRTLDEAQTRSIRNSLADISERIEKVNQTTENRLTRIQESNEKKLTEIQGIVDEKLQKTLEEKNCKDLPFCIRI